MRKRLTALSLVAMLLIVFSLSGCGSKTAQTTAAGPKKVTLTDMVGRKVTLTVPAKRVVAVGPGALRLYCYINSTHGLVGVENIEKRRPALPADHISWPIRI
jgi:iron complex transport system substrate-binding protein